MIVILFILQFILFMVTIGLHIAWSATLGNLIFISACLCFTGFIMATTR